MSTQGFGNTKFDEIVLASFGQFQIAVLSSRRRVMTRFLSGEILIPERHYNPIGWLFQSPHQLGWLQGLEIHPLQTGPFQLPRRIAPAVPLSFEVRSTHPLPRALHQQAEFSCQFTGSVSPFCTIFRHQLPRFVQTYALADVESLSQTVQDVLKIEQAFVQTCHDQLVHVPFYQQQFGLKVNQPLIE